MLLIANAHFQLRCAIFRHPRDIRQRDADPFEGVARALLGTAFLVDDLDGALATWGSGEAGLTLVTPAGETVAASGAIAGGSERSEETLLAQRRELRSLDD